jgi:hypothetical protein
VVCSCSETKVSTAAAVGIRPPPSRLAARAGSARQGWTARIAPTSTAEHITNPSARSSASTAVARSVGHASARASSSGCQRGRVSIARYPISAWPPTPSLWLFMVPHPHSTRCTPAEDSARCLSARFDAWNPSSVRHSVLKIMRTAVPVKYFQPRRPLTTLQVAVSSGFPGYHEPACAAVDPKWTVMVEERGSSSLHAPVRSHTAVIVGPQALWFNPRMILRDSGQ